MRKEADIVITEAGRDAGKTFHIREMPAAQAERWAMRALLALAHSGVDLGPNALQGGMAALAVAGIQALSALSFEEIDPLLREMWTCVSIKPDRANPNVMRPVSDDDFEEVATRLKLRWEVFDLHVGFSSVAGNSTSSPATSSQNTAFADPNTSTSPQPSGPVYHPAKPRSRR